MALKPSAKTCYDLPFIRRLKIHLNSLDIFQIESVFILIEQNGCPRRKKFAVVEHWLVVELEVLSGLPEDAAVAQLCVEAHSVAFTFNLGKNQDWLSVAQKC